MGDNIPDKRV